MKNQNLEMETAKGGTLHVLRAIPGRVRFRFEAEKSDTQSLGDFDFLGIEGAEAATFNKTTRSLLIIYNEEALSLKKLISEIEGRMPLDVLEKSQNSQTEKPVDPNSSYIQIIRKFNGRLRIRSDLLFKDMKSRCCCEFVEMVFNIHGVKNVKINSFLQTALICYDSNQVSENSILNTILRKKRRKKKNIIVSPLLHRLNGEEARFNRYDNLITNWEISHELPGRLRIKQPILYQRKETCKEIEKILSNTLGIENAQVNHITTSILVTYDETTITKNQLIKIMEDTLQTMPDKYWRKEELKLSPFQLSTISLGLSTAGASLFPWMIPLNIALISCTAFPIFKKSYDALLKRKIKVDILDAAVISLCLVMNQIPAAAFMIWILDVADKILEQTSAQSREFLSQIFGKHPQFAWILKDKQEIKVPVEKLKSGDIVVVSTGEQILVDGKVCRGEGIVDQHILTGESAPVEKIIKDKAFASTVLLAGKIYIKAENVGKNTIEAKILKIITQSVNYKPEIQSMGERIADKMVVPTFCLGAIGAVSGGPSAALAVLNADYGTGIRIAAPTATLVFLANAARKGIVIKKGSVLETLHKMDTFIFDKTGTLTHEIPEVTRIICAGKDFTEEQILAYTAAAEQRFSHPLARAVLRKAKESNLELPERDESKYHVGFGIEISIGNDIVKVGSARFMEREKIIVPLTIQKKLRNIHRKGKSAILLSINDTLSGAIEFKSSHRPEAYGVIQKLKERGKDIILISGDHKAPTKNLANQLGIDRYYAEILPQDKAKYVKMLQKQGKKVAMIGDGINDSVALSLADISISLRGASDVATDIADVVFMDGDLTKFDLLFNISEEFQKNVKRSFHFIAIPNTICILGALAGFAGLGISLLLNNVFNIIATVNATLPLYTFDNV